jgi:xanthine dehydrogenase small subunit
MPRSTISFIRRGQRVDVSNIDPKTTLLDWLRLQERSTGTKEGCAEGDCGACTVVLARERDGKLVYEPVNACILLLGQVDGAEVITVEDLAQSDELHKVQKAMVQNHASQCGFCTPGIVMSLFALSHSGSQTISRSEINSALAGNLCRCTGYRPIIDAAIEACSDPSPDQFDARAQHTLELFKQFRSLEDVFVGNEDAFFAAPAAESSLAFLVQKYPDATLIAGATDVGLWITRGLAPIKKLIWLGRIRGLAAVEETKTTLSFGAGVSHDMAAPYLGAIDQDFKEIAGRFGSQQVRTSGTVVGNIANGSPIGDWPPCFIILDAEVELRAGLATRMVALEDYFIAYKQQNRQPGEYLRRVILNKPAQNDHIRLFKITKRRDEDISAVMSAFRITIEEGLITKARIAFGGMAGIPKRARATEAAIIGQPIKDIATWRAGAEALLSDFTPLSDHRASADYRMRVARNLVIKALAEIAGVPSSSTRIVGLREAAYAAE